MAQVHGQGDGPSQGGWIAQSSPYGVWGDSHTGMGVVGTSDTNNGVYGYSGSSTGVVGDSDQEYGVWGIGGNVGVYGISKGHETGVVGLGDNAGVAAFNAHNNNAAYLASDCCAAWFTGQVHITGLLSVSGGKSALVRHPDGTHRQLYCMESPESWFEDFGDAELRDGEADIRIDPEFAALVHRERYHVFLTPYGDSNGLYVAERRTDGFRVREHQGGKHSLEFSYRVVAKRGDLNVVRLEPVHLPTQPSKPPQPRVPVPPREPSRKG